MPELDDFNRQVIEEFRANAGVVGGMFAGRPLLLLHHVGARSGQSRIAPLVYLPDAGRWVIFASKGGAPENPAWYHNLLAHPDTEIEVGSDTLAVRAVAADEPERSELFERQVAEMPTFAEYQEKAGRIIPVVVLEPR